MSHFRLVFYSSSVQVNVYKETKVFNPRSSLANLNSRDKSVILELWESLYMMTVLQLKNVRPGVPQDTNTVF